MTYRELKKRQQSEFDAFSREKMFFAFNKEQFNDGLAKLGCTASELSPIICGGFVRISDRAEYDAMSKRHFDELQEQIRNDTTGDGFIFSMFDYELSNHEFSYTGDPNDAISACGLTLEDLQNNPALVHGLNRAMQNQMEVNE